MHVNEQLQRLDALVKRMVKEHRELKQENENLTQRIRELSQDVKQKDGKLEMLNSELKNLRLARGMGQNPEEVKAAKARLGSLVREIDRCIALLNE